jgi:hypothetical protein
MEGVIIRDRDLGLIQAVELKKQLCYLIRSYRVSLCDLQGKGPVDNAMLLEVKLFIIEAIRDLLLVDDLITFIDTSE